MATNYDLLKNYKATERQKRHLFENCMLALAELEKRCKYEKSDKLYKTDGRGITALHGAKARKKDVYFQKAESLLQHCCGDDNRCYKCNIFDGCVELWDKLSNVAQNEQKGYRLTEFDYNDWLKEFNKLRGIIDV